MDLEISPIFNVSDLYSFKDSDTFTTEMAVSGDDRPVEWKEQLPKKGQQEIEAILDKRVSKRTRNKDHFQYLIKWKQQPLEDSIWMTAAKISKYNVDPEKLLKVSFLPRESDAGAPDLDISSNWTQGSNSFTKEVPESFQSNFCFIDFQKVRLTEFV